MSDDEIERGIARVVDDIRRRAHADSLMSGSPVGLIDLDPKQWKSDRPKPKPKPNFDQLISFLIGLACVAFFKWVMG